MSIIGLGLFNLLGPKRLGRFRDRAAAALAMVGITLMIAIGSAPQIEWSRIEFGHLDHGLGRNGSRSSRSS